MSKLRQKIGIVAFWLAWPALYVYLHGSTRTRALIVCRGEILLVRTTVGDGRFALPGGGVHAGEQLESALQREVAEETGIHISGPRVLGAEPVHEHGFRFFVHFFAVRLRIKPELRLQWSEISDARWVKLAEVPNLPCKPEVQRALELLNKR